MTEPEAIATELADRDRDAVDLGDAQRVAVEVGVAGEHVDVGEGRVLGGGQAQLVVGHRRVVGRGDADRDRADVGAALAVGHGVVEAHRAGEIEVRGEGEGAPGVQRDRAGGDRHRVADRDRDAVDLGDAQRVAVEVGVAGEHVDVGEGRVLGGGQAQLVVGHRRVVGRGDADRDRADVGAALAVGHGVVEAHRAGEIEVRGEGEGAPGVQRHEPEAIATELPTVIAMPLIWVMLNGSPSRSVSPVSTSMLVRGVSSGERYK